jgi:hypothetical protein
MGDAGGIGDGGGNPERGAGIGDGEVLVAAAIIGLLAVVVDEDNVSSIHEFIFRNQEAEIHGARRLGLSDEPRARPYLRGA